MAFATYAELQVEVADWAHRSDLTAKIPRFIQLAEAGFNKVLQSRLQEVDTTVTSVIGSRYIALPLDFYEARALWITEWEPRDQLVFKLPEQLILGSVTSTGSPENWTIDGANLAFDYVADKEYSFTFRYTKALNLSDVVTTNWLLTDHPDLYLTASMAQLCIYIKDMKALQVWKPMYDEALQAVFDKETRIKNLATLESDEGLLANRGRGFNINDGNYN